MIRDLPQKDRPPDTSPGFFARWRRRLTWLVVVAIAAYFAVQLADYVWFRSQVPIGFTNANWSGRWQTRVWGISGRILVRLPDPLPENEDFKAEALVYYPIYSGWKTGRFVKMDFHGRFDPAVKSSAGESTNQMPGDKEVGGKFTFKAVAGKQTVDYVAIMDDRRTSITGGYLSESPFDYGVFWIRYY